MQCERDPHNVVDRYSVLCTPRFFVLPMTFSASLFAKAIACEGRLHDSLRSSSMSLYRCTLNSRCRKIFIVIIIFVWPARVRKYFNTKNYRMKIFKHKISRFRLKNQESKSDVWSRKPHPDPHTSSGRKRVCVECVLSNCDASSCCRRV